MKRRQFIKSAAIGIGAITVPLVVRAQEYDSNPVGPIIKYRHKEYVLKTPIVDAATQLRDAQTLSSRPGGILTNKRKDELKLLKVGEFHGISNAP